MRNKKLIAILVAGLFAEGTAWADDNFNWSGNLELGGRATNTDGATRNGARGTSATTLTPFTGPEDAAKAQEYQDPSSGVIGVIDVRGSNRAYYMSLFGENLGRDDQYIFARGGGYDVFKVGFYSDRMPHNLSFNALTPLNWPGSSLQPAPAGAYPPATNPATWNNFEYGLQRNTIGGNVEVNARSPFFGRVDYNEVQTTGIRPSSGQLGTGSGNGLIEFGLPTDYVTKNSVIEGGYKGRNWNVKLGYLNSKFSSNTGDTAQWGNFYMRSALDTSLQPQDNELQKWTLNFAMRDLWLDSTMLVRLTQSTLTSDFGVESAGLKPAGTATQAPSGIPAAVGNLVTAPSSSTFYGEHKTTTATFSLQSTPMPGLGTRLYYEYYDKQNDSTPINYAAGALPSTATAPCTNTATRYCMAAYTAPEPFEYTKNEFGLEANYGFGRYGKLLGGLNFVYTDRNLEPAPQTDDMRLWAEWRASMGDTLSGRLKYQFMQRDSELNPSYTNNASNVQPTTVPYYFRAYDVGNFDQNMVKFNVDWNPMALLTIGFGATWRQTDYKDFYFGRNEDTTQNYDLTVSYGNADKFLLTGIANWGETTFDQSYRNTASGASPTPGGTQTATTFDWGTHNTQENWLFAVLADWMATDKLKLTGSASWSETNGGVDFWSGSYAGAGGFNGGPLVNYITDNTRTERYQIKGEYRINRNWSATAGYAYEKYDYEDDQMRGYASFYPYYQNLGGTNNTWNSGAFTNPSYKNNIFFITAKYSFDTPQTPARLVAQAPAPAPVAKPVPPPPPPAPAPAPAPTVQKITLDSKVLFDFDKAVLKPEGKAAIDSQVVGKLAQIQKLEVVLVSGHTDPLGTDAYNQKLSERRAETVRDYLVSKGVPKDKIEALGLGEKQLLPGVVCEQKNLKEKIACLQPHRRVEIQAKGEAVKR